eukprot:1069783-Amphidinium_carterae.2
MYFGATALQQCFERQPSCPGAPFIFTFSAPPSLRARYGGVFFESASVCWVRGSCNDMVTATSKRDLLHGAYWQ